MAVDYNPSKPGIQSYEDVYGPRELGEARIQERIKFLKENQYNPEKDYSKDFGELFGSDYDKESPLYYSGPNPNWWHALSDRLKTRQSKNENMFGGTGYYEGSTYTMDRDLQKQMYRRNNAIEDMYRKGYSHDQILAHTSGKRNVLEEGPDWSEYKKAAAGEGLYGATPRQKGWYEDYFVGAPKEVTTQGPDTEQPPTEQPPLGPGKGGSGPGKGGGQVEAPAGPRYQSSAPFQSQRPRSNMYSSSPLGLGTGYYGGMGSGGRQFGGQSYFGGFGGAYSQPSYQQSYQQPYYGSYGQSYQPSRGYSSFGGYGGSMGGIGNFYRPMGYGGYR